MPEKLLSIQEAAKKLKVSTKTLRRWESKGTLIPNRTTGSHRRYSEQQIKDFITQLKVQKEAKKNLTAPESPFIATVLVPQDAPVITQQIDEQPQRVQRTPIIAETPQVPHYRFNPPTPPPQPPPPPVPPAREGKPNPINQAFSRRRFLFYGGGILTAIFLLTATYAIGQLVTQNMANKIAKEAQKTTSNSSSTPTVTFSGNIDIKSNFSQDVEFKKDVVIEGVSNLNGGINTNGANIDLGGGSITAANVIYDITAGDGISVSDSQYPVISNTGVLSLQDKTGALTLEAGSGISIDGLKISSTVSQGSTTNSFETITNGTDDITAGSATDILTLTAGNNISLNFDTSNNEITISSIGSNAVINIEEDNVVLSTQSSTLDFLGNDFTLSESPAGEINVAIDYPNSHITRDNQTQTISSAWTFASSLTLSGLGAGSGTNLCVDGSNNIVTCAASAGVTSLNSLTGALTLANATTGGSTITINDASTAQKGIAQFNATNFSASSGTINTIQNINSAATPTFAGMTLSGFSANGVVTNNSSGVLSTATTLSSTLGGTGQNFSSSTGIPTLSSGTWSVAAQLTALRGGTGVDGSTAGNGTLLIGNGSGYTIANLSAGNGISITNGAGSITLSTSLTGSNWSLNTTNGIISPNNNTVDFLIGSTSSSSAKFAILNVAGTRGAQTATLSGSLTLDSAGSLSTTNNQTLTLGSGSTGNIVLSPIGGAGSVTSTGTINIASGKVFQINGVNVLTGNSLGSGILSSSLTSVGTLTGGTWNAAAIGSQYGGTGVDGSAAGNGTILIGNGSGYTLANLTGGNGISITNGSGSINLAVSSQITPKFTQNDSLGILTPNNNTLDLLVGGATTDSARFAILGTANARGSQIATLSGSLTLDAVGSLSTTNNQTLTVGGNNTGTLILGRTGQSLAFGNTSFANCTSLETVNGILGCGTDDLGGAGSTPNFWQYSASTGIVANGNLTTDLLLGSTSSNSARFAVLNVAGGTPTASLSAGINSGLYLTANGVIASEAKQSLTIGSPTTGNIVLSGFGAGILKTSAAGTVSTGSVDINLETTGTLGVNRGGTGIDASTISDGQLLIGNDGANGFSLANISGSNGIIVTNGAGSISISHDASLLSKWTQNSTLGTISPNNNTLDMLIGGATSDSAKFAILNVAGTRGTQTATLSGSITLDSVGSLSTTNNQTLTLGGGSTGTLLIGRNGQNVSFGSTTFANCTSLETVNGILGCGTDDLGGAGSTPNFWQYNASTGIVANGNLTTDLLLGSTSTSAARFAVLNVAGGNPTASVSAGTSGGLFVNATGNIQTTTRQSLTLGGGDSGNIVLSGFGTGIVKSNATGTLTSSAIDLGSTDVTGTLGVNRGGTGVDASTITDGQLLIGNDGTNGFSLASITGSNGIIVTNGAGSISISQTASLLSKWTQNDTLGTLTPNNNTLDLLVGGATSDSAKFAILGIAGTRGTQIASISGSLVLDAVGSLSTTNTQTLTVGGGNTGTLILGRTGQNLHLGSTSFANCTALETVNGIIGCGTDDLGSGAEGVSNWSLSITNGVISPNNNTLDLLIGGTSTSSAKFGFINVAGGTPTATMSAGLTGGLFTTATGTIQTTAKQSLTLGGGDTGSLVLSGFGTGVIKSNATGTLSSSAVDLGSSDVTGTLGATRGGTGVDASTITDGQLLIGNDGTNGFSVASLTAGAGISITNGAGAITIAQTSGSLSKWTQDSSLGILKPNNNTLDLLVGGATSSSAKFAILGVAGNRGAQTATLSGSLTLDSAGVISTTNNQTLTIGGGNTGTLVLGRTAQNLSLGSTTYANCSALETVNGIIECGNDDSGTGSDGTSNWTISALSGTLSPNNNTLDLLIGGTSSTSAKFAVLGVAGNRGSQVASLSGSLTFDAAGSISTTNNQTLTIGGNNTGNIVLGGFGAGIVKTNATGVLSSSAIDLGSTDVSGTLGVNRGGTGVDASTIQNGQLLIGNDSTNGFSVANITGSNGIIVTNGAGSINVSQNADLQSKWTQDSTLGLLTPHNNTLDLLVGGATSDSAKFALLGVAGARGTQTATLSGSLTLDAAGAIQTTNNQTLTIGGGSTGTLILGRTGQNLQLGSSTFATCASLETVNGFLTCGTDDTGTGADGVSNWTVSTLNGTISPNNNTLDLLLGGTTTSSAKFAFLNVAGGTPTASVSGGLVGGLFVNATGNIQTTARQSLTLGGGETGNIILSGFSSGIVKTNATGTLSSSAIDLSTSEVTGTLGVNRGGTGVDASTIADGQLLIGNDGTNGFSVASLTAGAGISISNGAGSITISQISGSLSKWTQDSTLGILKPNNNTLDVLIGGATTESARFAILGVAGARGAQVATLSGSLTFDAVGSLSTTNNQTLAVGGGNTGTLILGRSGQNISLGSSSFANCSSLETVNGILGCGSDDTGSAATPIFWQYDASTGVVANGNLTTDLLLGGTSTESAKFAVTGIAAGNNPTATLSAGTTGGAYLSASGTLQTTANQQLILGGDSTGDITLSPKNGSGRVTLDAGTISIDSNTNFSYLGNESISVTSSSRTLSTPVLNLNSTNSGGNYSALQMTTSSTNTGADPGSYGLNNILSSSAIVAGAGTSQTFTGSYNVVSKTGADTATGTMTLRGVLGSAINTGSTDAGTKLTIGGYFDATGDTAGSSTGIGVYIDTVTGSDNNYALCFDCDGSWSSNSVASGIQFGTDNKSLSLYRSGNNILQTDGQLFVNSGNFGATSALIVNQTGASTNDILTASASGLTKFVIKNDGTASSAAGFVIDAAGALSTTNNQTLTVGGGTSGNLIIGQTGKSINFAASALANCSALETVNGILGCGTDDQGSGGDGVSNWTINNTLGYLTPNNNTLDLLVGGNASTSAKFAVLNVAGGTPTASISADTGNGTVFIAGNGNIGTTARQHLTLGNTTSGGGVSIVGGNTNTTNGTGFPISITAGNGNALGTGGSISLAAGTSSQGAGGSISLAAGTAPDSSSANGGSISLALGSGGSTFNGVAGNGGNFNVSFGAGGVGNLGDGGTGGGVNWALGAGGTTASGGKTSGAGGSFIINAGAAGSSAGTGNSGGVITLIAGASTNAVAGGAVTLTAGQGGATGLGGAISLTTGAGGATSGASGALTLGTGTFTSGGFGTISLKQGTNTRLYVDENGLLGVGTTSPVAPLHMNGGYGSNAAFILNQTNSGDIFAASASGTTKFVVNNDGTASSSAGFTLNGVGNIQSTNAQTLTIGGGTSGGLIIGRSGANINFGSSTFANCSALETVNGILGCGTDDLGSSVSNFWQINNGVLSPGNQTLDFAFGGSTTSSAYFKLTALGTAPTASISGRTANATLSLDNLSTFGDIFTASSSGNTQLVLKNNGALGIGFGARIPTAQLDVAGAASIASQLSFRNGAGAIQTTGNNTLTIGGSTTGNIVISPKNGLGFVGIGTSSPAYPLDILSSAGAGSNNPTMRIMTTVDRKAFQVISADGAASNEEIFALLGDDVADKAFQTGLSSDNTNRFSMLVGGDMSWGPGGSSARDVRLCRTTNNTLLIEDNGSTCGAGSAGNLTVTGTISLGTNNISLSGTTLSTSGSNNNLTLTPNGSGDIILTSDSNTGISIGTSSNTQATLSVNGGIGSNAGFVINRVGSTDDIFAASSSGTTKFVIRNDGTASSAAGFVVDTAGGIQTTKSQTLTIGGGTSGGLILGRTGVNINFGSSTFANCSALETVNGILGCGTDDLGAGGSGSNFWQYNTSTGIVANGNLTTDFLLGAVSSDSAKFAILGVAGSRGTQTATLSGSLTLDAAGSIQTTNAQLLTLGGSSTGDINFAPGNSSTSLYLNSAGNVGLGITSPTTKLHVLNTSSGSTTNSLTVGNGANGDNTGSRINFNLSTNSTMYNAYIEAVRTNLTANLASYLAFGTHNGTSAIERLRIGETGNVGIGTSTALSSLHLTRPLSFGANGKALVILDQIENQDILTASASGSTVFTLRRDGTASSSGGFTVNGAGSIQSTNNQTLTVGGGSTGDLVIGRTSQRVYLPGFSDCSALETVNGILGCGTDDLGGGGGANFWQTNSGVLSPGNQTLDFTFGATATSSAKFALSLSGTNPTAQVNGTTSFAAFAVNNGGVGDILTASSSGITKFTIKSNGTIIGGGANTARASLDVRAQNGTLPVASVSGATSFAGMIVDNSGVGDIFTASSSGMTRFTVKQNGIVQIGNDTNGIVFDYLNQGARYTGNARPSKTISLNAEYAGAILTASGSATTTGTMTSDASTSAALSNWRTYYEWSSTQTTLHNYTVALRVTLPPDFSSWATTNAITVSYNTELTTSDSQKLDVFIYNSDTSLSGADQATPVVYRQNNVSATQKTWLDLSIDDSLLDSGASRDIDAAGDSMIIMLKLSSKDSNHVQLGDIKLNYLSSY